LELDRAHRRRVRHRHRRFYVYAKKRSCNLFGDRFPSEGSPRLIGAPPHTLNHESKSSSGPGKHRRRLSQNLPRFETPCDSPERRGFKPTHPMRKRTMYQSNRFGLPLGNPKSCLDDPRGRVPRKLICDLLPPIRQAGQANLRTGCHRFLFCGVRRHRRPPCEKRLNRMASRAHRNGTGRQDRRRDLPANKDRERNGGRSVEELVHHIGDDTHTLVGSAWPRPALAAVPSLIRTLNVDGQFH
jgi:hypothetical protein